MFSKLMIAVCLLLITTSVFARTNGGGDRVLNGGQSSERCYYQSENTDWLQICQLNPTTGEISACKYIDISHTQPTFFQDVNACPTESEDLIQEDEVLV